MSCETNPTHNLLNTVSSWLHNKSQYSVDQTCQAKLIIIIIIIIINIIIIIIVVWGWSLKGWNTIVFVSHKCLC